MVKLLALTPLVLLALLLSANGALAEDESALPYATCDGCFCVPEDNESCPRIMPETNFTELLPLYRSLELTNPFTLDCDPYKEGCDLLHQSLVGEEGVVCAIRYSYDGDGNSTCPTSYSLESVASQQEAQAQGLAVTHFGGKRSL